MDQLLHLISGNIGAAQIVSRVSEIAPEVLATLLAFDIRGSDLYTLHKSVCGRDDGKFVALVRAGLLGDERVTPETLKASIAAMSPTFDLDAVLGVPPELREPRTTQNPGSASVTGHVSYQSSMGDFGGMMRAQDNAEANVESTDMSSQGYFLSDGTARGIATWLTKGRS